MVNSSHNVLVYVMLFAQLLYAQGDVGNPIVVNSPLLKINYVIDKSGNVPKNVVLWYRHENPKWKIGGVFPTGQPIEFFAKEQGGYEFCLTFDKKTPPVDNVAATYQVLVDFGKPLIQITQVKYANGRIAVRWRAYDENFSDRPIDIYQIFSNGQNKFLGQFANTGIAVIDVSADSDFRLKLIAKDKAGNCSTDVSELIVVKRKITKKVVTTKSAEHKIAPPKDSEANNVVKRPKKPSKDAMEQYELAKRYLNRGQIEFAKSCLLQAIKLAPEFSDAQTDLADILMKQGKYSQAENYFLQAAGIDAHNIRCLEGLAKIKIRQGQYNQARAYLQRILKEDKQNVRVMLKLGDVYWLMGEQTRAAAIWKQAQTIIDKGKIKKFEGAVKSRLELVDSK